MVIHISPNKQKQIYHARLLSGVISAKTFRPNFINCKDAFAYALVYGFSFLPCQVASIPGIKKLITAVFLEKTDSIKTFIALRYEISTLVFLDYAAFGNSSKMRSNRAICSIQSLITFSDLSDIRESGSVKPYVFIRSFFASSMARSTLRIS